MRHPVDQDAGGSPWEFVMLGGTERKKMAYGRIEELLRVSGAIPRRTAPFSRKTVKVEYADSEHLLVEEISRIEYEKYQYECLEKELEQFIFRMRLQKMRLALDENRQTVSKAAPVCLCAFEEL
jgi:hypothetical protein